MVEKKIRDHKNVLKLFTYERGVSSRYNLTLVQLKKT